jgi:hypothetical protein
MGGAVLGARRQCKAADDQRDGSEAAHIEIVRLFAFCGLGASPRARAAGMPGPVLAVPSLTARPHVQ